MVSGEQGLGIEGIDLRRTAMEKDEYDSLCSGGIHRRLGSERIIRLVGVCFIGKQAKEGHVPKA